MGMRLCAASNDVLFRDIEHFIKLLNITHLSLTPSVANLITATSVPDVQVLVSAGEPLTRKVFRDWAGRGLWQGYGPSETTNICSVHPKVSPSDHINNVGIPLPNTSMFVSSQDVFRPLPKGALGEIWIGGEQVGQGYLNNAELTAEKFVHHSEYGMLYRSGDFGRMLPNGNILFHGRQDDQVKLRGQRIELGEIEQALITMPMVSDGVVLLIEGFGQTPDRLIAYWSSPNMYEIADQRDCIDSMFDELRSQLPMYMVPDYLIYVEKFPLTSQGKTDRMALKALFQNMKPTTLGNCSKQDHVSEGGGLNARHEILVAEALADVTGAPLGAIARDTSFFALGLDSISCIRFCRNCSTLALGRLIFRSCCDMPPSQNFSECCRSSKAMRQ